MVTDSRILSKSVKKSSTSQRIRPTYPEFVFPTRRVPAKGHTVLQGPSLSSLSSHNPPLLTAGAWLLRCCCDTLWRYNRYGVHLRPETAVSFLCGVSAGRLLPQVVSAWVEVVEVLPGGRLDRDEALSAVFLRGRVCLQTGSDVSRFYRQERSSGDVTKLSEHADQR